VSEGERERERERERAMRAIIPYLLNSTVLYRHTIRYNALYN